MTKKATIKAFCEPQASETKIMVIQELVARMFAVPVERLSLESRERAVTIPRQIAMYLINQETDASLTEIGSSFGGKHHTTVMNAISRVDELRRTDPAFDSTIRGLQQKLKWSSDSTTP